jgi:hypothetical protein
MAQTTDVVRLDASKAWSVKARRGPVEIEVLQGRVLVTLEGDAADHVLSAGDVFSASRGRVAATGLGPSLIRASARSPAAFAPFARQARRDGRGLARHLLGGTFIIAVWVSLWAWVAVGVVQPLSTVRSQETTAVVGDAS